MKQYAPVFLLWPSCFVLRGVCVTNMDMWNWLLECYDEGSLTERDLENIMKSDKHARMLWEDWSNDSVDFIEYVREQVLPVLDYIAKKVKDKEKDNVF